MTDPAAQLRARRTLSPARHIGPDPQNDLELMRACLLPDERAIAAWQRWRRRARPVDDLPSDQHRLIPLLHHNLSSLGVYDPELARYAGVRRFYWVFHHARRRAFSPALDAFEAAGVRFMLLKSFPLLRAYPSPELRPSNDLDVWIHEGDLPGAVGVLTSLGFTPIAPRLLQPGALERAWHARHAVGFKAGAERVEIDLHARLHPALPSLTLANQLYSRAQQLRIGERHLPSIPNAGALLHAAVYAQENPGRPMVRGVVDVAIALRSPDFDIDWQEVFALARRSNALTPLARSLRMAYPLIGSEIPEGVASLLRSAAPGRSDRFYWKLAIARGPAPAARETLLQYVRAREVAAADGRPRQGPLAFLRDFVHARSRLTTIGLLLRWPFRQAWRRLRREPVV